MYKFAFAILAIATFTQNGANSQLPGRLPVDAPMLLVNQKDALTEPRLSTPRPFQNVHFR
jgi:hypothetical protein